MQSEVIYDETGDEVGGPVAETEKLLSTQETPQMAGLDFIFEISGRAEVC